MNVHEPWNAASGAELVMAHADQDGALLPVLHALQERFGHVPDAAVPIIAGALNISRADVHGVLTFYHDFRRAPAGRHVLKICRAEACQARGADTVVGQCESALGVPLGETTADGRTTFEAIYCLGVCASGPAAMLDGRLIGRLDPASTDRMLSEARA